MADAQTLEIKDFSGGITDNYIGGQLRKFQALDNMVLRSDNKPQTRPGGIIMDDDYPQLPFVTTEKRGDSSCRFKSLNIFQTQNKLYHIKAGVGFTEIVGPSSNSAFSSSTVQYDQCSYDEWNNHLLVTSDRRERPKFIFKDGSDLRLRNIGLPAIDPSGIGFTAGATASREYAIVLAYTYTIDGITFTMRGAPAYKAYTGAIPNSITSIPVLTNGASDSYDTANIKVEFYRTADAGSTHYKVGEVTNGTTTFSDTTADVDLADADGLLLYTDASDLDYDQPPLCKYLVQLNGSVFYMNIEDSAGDIFPNRIIQAPPDQIYAANEGNSTDVPGDLTGGGVAGQNVMAFTADGTYRLEGVYDSTGAGGSRVVEVSRTVGCISHKSIIQTQEGLYFAAKDGFYFTDGYKVYRISEEINSTFAASTATETIRKRIYGAHDPVTKRAYWTACSDSDQTDADMLFVAHLFWGLKPDTAFTIWNGGYWASNFAPTSLLFYDNKLVSTDKRGYLLQYADGQLNDIKIDTAADPEDWTQLPVIYDIRTAATDFGTATLRKWVPRITLYADAIARAAITVSSNNDNSGIFTDLAEITSNSPVLWNDFGVLWRDSSIRWNYLPIISAIRRFPSPVRCSFKQIRISNAYTLVDSSDLSGFVSVDGTAKTATLLNTAYSWDTNAVDYYMSFEDDDYVAQYRVEARTSATVLTLEDTLSSLTTSASTSFKLRGYRKNEALRLLSISLIWQPISPTQSPPNEAA